MATAFEHDNLGVTPELGQAVADLGWQLPTAIQYECIPLILGGGDVLAAAETGSGKTGAFGLPILQVVHESIRSRQAGGTTVSGHHEKEKLECVLSADDRDALFAVSPDGHRCQARNDRAWAGGRGTVGARQGRVYYEITVADEGLCRVGWSTCQASLDLGNDPVSFGFGGTGKKSNSRQFDSYGAPYGQNDIIGCMLDCDSGSIAFSKNGEDLGPAFQIPGKLQGSTLYPAICLKNAELVVNFGEDGFKYGPPKGFVGLAKAPQEWVQSGEDVAAAGSGRRKPTAIILEPSKDLAEQTHDFMVRFKHYLTQPQLRCELLIGGTNPKQASRALEEGVDIITGTPGRIMDFIESGKLPTDAVKFFVLDEADRLLDSGSQELVLKLFSKLPKAATGTQRLQVLMFLATLHSQEVKDVASKICQQPIVVDLKGKEYVPETVDHVCVKLDPHEDRSWLQSNPPTPTDRCHTFDNTGPNIDTPENWSEAVKRLKPRMLQRIIDTFHMDQCLIFCRTNFDCDNLESFLTGLGGGGKFRGKMEKGVENPYSCLVLAGARSMDQRRDALQAFKDGDIRFLICTDVAARGIDIAGLPFVINMTLPDRSEDYIHRVGRVGRAGLLGLAISLVSTVPERVWYVKAKGYKPWLKPKPQDVKHNDEGGHTIWYNEPELLQEVEERLKQKVQPLSADLSLPAGLEKRMKTGQKAGGYGGSKEAAGYTKEAMQHLQQLQPAVASLADLEIQAQRSYWNLKQRWGEPQPTAA
ncbi:hypothetical protein ABBQ38_009184 [Trebouxia sp. C0009 RCD-2024]